MRGRVLLLIAVTVATGTVAPTAVEPRRIIELKETASPFVAFNVWVRSGSSSDPAGREGLASLTATLLASGSTKQDT